MNLKLVFVSFMITLALIATIGLSTPVQAAGVNGNPWNYDFVATGGRLIYAPNPAFCDGQYFKCIGNFSHGTGYVVECRDGMYSKSGGRTGSCSKHGGDGQALYAHESSVTSSGPSQPVTSQPVSSGGGSNASPGLPMTGSDPYSSR